MTDFFKGFTFGFVLSFITYFLKKNKNKSKS